MSGPVATRRCVPAGESLALQNEPDQAIFCIRSIRAVHGSFELRLFGLFFFVRSLVCGSTRNQA